MARVAAIGAAVFALSAMLPAEPPREAGVLHYSAEWRLMNAGVARLNLQPQPGQTDLHLETVGFVARLYKVNDDYSTLFNDSFCASSTMLTVNESKRRRVTRVTFNRPPGKASYEERDLERDAVVSTREIDVPPCVHDVLSGLARLRTMTLEPGQSIEMPLSDGKKSVSGRITALGRETLKTRAGEERTIRYEAILFNDVLYRRKGRLLLWLTDDARRLPVQIRIQLPFYLGTITLRLEKEEKS